LTGADLLVKRSFDLVVSVLGLMVMWPVIVICWVIAKRDTGASGFFLQDRVGRGGRLFKVVKLRTMNSVDGTTVTTANDPRITKWGARFRRWKLDELPQLWNVLLGHMSFVGPRPDVPGYMDRLEGNDLRLLQLRPGITGPATLRYRNEEDLLAAQRDPDGYNDRVIWPEKVRINLEYLDDWSLARDICYIIKTVRG
jgi:lipopolysaccharide/colanic/teichoic acid biosynthesis glycosyltransferase